MDLTAVDHEEKAEATFANGIITWKSNGNTWDEKSVANFDNVTAFANWRTDVSGIY